VSSGGAHADWDSSLHEPSRGPRSPAVPPDSAPAADLVYETRDSAGTRITVNTSFPSPEDRWVVEAEPFLSIGGVSADPPAMFTDVTQATRLRDGRIAILENETSELRFFAARGENLRTAGGRGEGPGEF